MKLVYKAKVPTEEELDYASIFAQSIERIGWLNDSKLTEVNGSHVPMAYCKIAIQEKIEVENIICIQFNSDGKELRKYIQCKGVVSEILAQKSKSVHTYVIVKADERKLGENVLYVE
ncbi:unnamed protein product [Gordionus sp. m RMFG-2023]